MNEPTMLRNINELIGAKILAKDGDIGKVRDFLFDDLQWTIRYVVADTGGWLTGRKVLISPFSLSEPNLGLVKTEIPVNLTRKQIEDAPSLEEEAPVSRRYERELARYYAFPSYWGSNMLWGFRHYPGETIPFTQEELAEQEKQLEDIKECHLRSAKEVTGYHILGLDGEIGHVDDFLVNQQSWALRFLVIDTKNWWPGKKVIVPPTAAHKVVWKTKTVQLQMKREQIKNSPEYFPDQPVSSALEEEIQAHSRDSMRVYT